MDFTESPEQQMLRAAVRDVAESFGHAYYAERARSGGHTDELWDAIAGLGFLGVHLPERYGGGGAGMSELAIVCEELAAVGTPLLLILVSPAICAELIKHFGTDAQKTQFLTPMKKDDVIAWAIQQGWAPRDDHQADALLLLAHAHGMRAERRRKAAWAGNAFELNRSTLGVSMPISRTPRSYRASTSSGSRAAKSSPASLLTYVTSMLPAPLAMAST
mgnify:CR=1 FL=1